MTAGQRLRYFFADTWWRVMWLVGAVTWCVVVNVLAISGDGDFTWWGPASVLPLLAFAAETIRRDHHLRHKQRAQ